MRATRFGSVAAFLVLCGSLAGAVASAPAAHASVTFTVNSTADLKDSNTHDGVCQASNGKCTLRAAVQQANFTGGPVLIKLGAGTYTISLGPAGEDQAAGGDLDIHTDMAIKGLGAKKTVVKVDRSSVMDRAFHVHQHVTATISGITITNGITLGGEEGAAIETDFPSKVTLVHDVLRANRSGGSGGAVSALGTLIAIDTVFAHNVSGNNGGAIRDYHNVKLMRSTVSGNTASGDGGAIDGAVFTISDSTVVGNSGSAGGLVDPFNTGQVTIVNSTISGNSPLDVTAPSATLTNAILATSNGTTSCNVKTLTATKSLIQDTKKCSPSGSGNITGQDPKLGPLQANGGPTPTMALLGGSQALDAGTATGCPARDQRGVKRPQGPGCDMGAYEVPYPAITKPTVSVEHVATFTVAWNILGGTPRATTFDVRFRDGKPGRPLGSFHPFADQTTAHHKSFTAPQFGLVYCFSARATDAGGNVSPFGPERCVTVEH